MMRGRVAALLPGLLVVLLVSEASRAAPIPFHATLSFRIGAGTIGNLEDHGFFVSGTGVGVAGAGGGPTLTALAIPSGAAYAQGTYPYSDPEAYPISGILIDASNASGTFTGSPLGGVLELRGTAKICLFAPCSNALANATVPLSVIGRPGTQAVGTATAVIPYTVQGASWTATTVSAAGLTAMGFAHGPASAASTAGQPGGVVSLVTPTYITVLNQNMHVVMLSRLTLEFVPEPGSALLLGSGVAGLLMVRRARRQRSGPAPGRSPNAKPEIIDR